MRALVIAATKQLAKDHITARLLSFGADLPQQVLEAAKTLIDAVPDQNTHDAIKVEVFGQGEQKGYFNVDWTIIVATTNEAPNVA